MAVRAVHFARGSISPLCQRRDFHEGSPLSSTLSPEHSTRSTVLSQPLKTVALAESYTHNQSKLGGLSLSFHTSKSPFLNAGGAELHVQRKASKGINCGKFGVYMSAAVSIEKGGGALGDGEGKQANGGAEEEIEAAKKAQEYTATMQQSTGDALMYRHELGMNYARVLPDLIVGSCLQKPSDVDRLREEAGVGTIYCLQQDPDLAYFSVNLGAIQARAHQRGDIEHVRSPIRDFDPFDLRIQLPKAVARLHKQQLKGASNLYIHCTAGLGRAPAVALAYMHWIRGFELDEANAVLQKVRRCHPKLESIRAATADIITDGSKEVVELQWGNRGVCHNVEIAGLDVGWGERLHLQHVVKEGRWILHRELPVGRYLYKYIVDGRWTYNPDALLTSPDRDGIVNNYIEVIGDPKNRASWSIRQRLMKEEPTLEERAVIYDKLTEMAHNMD